jgi:hypothetical protein
MTLGIIRTAWAGTSGGPGLTQLAITEATGAAITVGQAQSAVNAVRVFWDGIKGTLPNDITLTVSPVVDLYDEVTGELTGSTTAATPPTSVVGTVSSAFSMASGLKVNLNTGVIRFGRRVRGAIYVVPGAGTNNTDSGAIGSTVRATVNSAGATLLTAMNTAGLNLVVYSRPQTTPAARDGATSIVSGIETNEKVAVLRGRRD